jgi:hypothetical protein
VETRHVPASVGQRLLWQMDHYRGANGALNCPIFLRLRGALDVNALHVAAHEVSLRHDALRTTFAGRGARLTQLVHSRPKELEMAWSDLSGEPDPEAAVVSAMAAEAQLRVDPENWPVRLSLWRLGAGEHVLCVNMHHLITDGWSCAVVARDLGRLYCCRAAGDHTSLPPVGWQYPRWVEWQRELLQGEQLRRLREYWRRQLTGAQLPDLPRVASPARGDQLRTTVEHTVIPRAAVAALEALARRLGTALFTVLLSAYYLLLHRTSGQTDLAVASIFANRSRPELRHTVGFLSNMVVLRSRIDRQATFADLVRDVSDSVIGAFAHQDLPYQLLPLDTLRGSSARPESVVFQLFAGPLERTTGAGLVVEPIIVVPEGMGSRWDFELSLAPSGQDLSVLLCHAGDLYRSDWARGFVDDYVGLVLAAAARPAASGASLAVVTRA